MKKTITLMAIAACGMITMFSCKKNDNSGTVATGSMTATINGVSFSGSRCVATVENDSGLAITGGPVDGIGIGYPMVFISTGHYHGVGTYTSITLDDNAASIDSTSADDTSFNMGKHSVYSTLIITATTPNITGTFSFTTEDSTKVTNGSFTAIPTIE